MRHTTWRFKMSGSSEEEIIRKRLTVEGESGQDDRRITSLLKTFLKWCDLASLSEEDSQATYQKMLFTLGQVNQYYNSVLMIVRVIVCYLLSLKLILSHLKSHPK